MIPSGHQMDREVLSRRSNGIVNLDPDCLWFSQAVLDPEFSSGADRMFSDTETLTYAAALAASRRSLSLSAAIAELQSGEASVGEYPPIRAVMIDDDRRVALDNRRLFVFQQVQSPGLMIPVQMVPLTGKVAKGAHAQEFGSKSG